MTTMLPLMAVMADMNDSSFNIQPIGSCSSNSGAHQVHKREFDATMFDRPDICALNNRTTVDTSPQRNVAQRSMPLISKKDFVEQWLLEHSDVIHNEIQSDHSSSSAVDSESTKSKRVLRSPFRNFNEIKRFKNARDNSINSMKCLMDVGSPTRSKENRVGNMSKGQVGKICRYMSAEHMMKTSNKCLSTNFGRFPSNDCSDFKFQTHKDVISSSPKKVIKQSLGRDSKKVLETTAHSFKSCRITPYESPVRQIINDIECQLPDITEVESVAPSSPLFDSIDDCIECESPQKSDIQSLPSSPQVMKVCIDSGSSDITDPGHDSITDTDIDKTISQVIDDSDAILSISMNNSECEAVPALHAERQVISPVNSSASDETFFSRDNSINRTIIEQDDILPSQMISGDYVSPQNCDVKSDCIDQEISSGNSLSLPSSKLENLDGYPVVATTAIKKRRKPKKGSLGGRLQALIVGQTSFLRIWRHQMTQKHLEKTNKQFILLKIKNCTSIYNRQYLIGSVISDTHNLLDKVGENRSAGKHNLHSPTTLTTKTVTIVTAPEIVGTINIKENSAIEIYPPWEVIDAQKIILSVLYFRMITNNDSLTSEENSNKKTGEFIERFDCPCLAAGQLVDSCQTKFTNVKPNLMQYLFTD